jgi:hypothetical protein
MNSSSSLTEAERSTLEEVSNLLGDNLTNFLLSSLGETDIAHRRSFTAQCIPSHSEETTYQLEMINDSTQGLPIGRDPLVLASLLDLLWERQPLDSTILFHESDILEKLQWPPGDESRRSIKLALERYLSTTYCLIDPIAAEDDCLGGRYASVGRLLIGYESTAVLQSRKISNQPRAMRVQFLPALIHDVISERKYFLGIDFQGSGKIQQLSS